MASVYRYTMSKQCGRSWPSSECVPHRYTMSKPCGRSWHTPARRDGERVGPAGVQQHVSQGTAAQVEN